MPTGIVPADEGLLVGAVDDGLHVIDPDGATTRLVVSYPPELGGRCNDACADLAGNIITGKLNLGPTEGSAWWWPHQHGWRIIDPDIANTNRPAVGVIDGSMTPDHRRPVGRVLLLSLRSHDRTVGVRSVFGDTSRLEGMPDGSTLDADGGPVVRARRRRPVGPLHQQRPGPHPPPAGHEPHRRDLRRSVARSALRRLDWIRRQQPRRRPARHRWSRHARPSRTPLHPGSTVGMRCGAPPARGLA